MKILRHRKIATTLERYTHRIFNKQVAAQGKFLAAIGKKHGPKKSSKKGE
jgi:hypothetical protein